jgi:putative addiction module CopG family antidote
MPNIDLSPPYKTYIDGLIDTGLFKTTAEVVKDALRLHMEQQSRAKKLAYIQSAIAEGEADIAAGRYTTYTPGFFDSITEDIISNAEQQ